MGSSTKAETTKRAMVERVYTILQGSLTHFIFEVNLPGGQRKFFTHNTASVALFMGDVKRPDKFVGQTCTYTGDPEGQITLKRNECELSVSPWKGSDSGDTSTDE